MPDFAELIERHQGMVFRTLARLTGESDVEDLAQEVFLRLFRGIREFRGEAKITTFLYRIIVNVVNDEWRRKQAARRNISIDDEEGGWKDRLPHPGPGPAQEMESRRLERLLQEAMAGLNPAERAAITLYVQEQRSYEEISAILKVPVGTVKTHLHRARQKLKQTLRERISPCPTAK